MQFLRSSVGGNNYRYQIPWFLVLGEPQSGKSALMAAAGVECARQPRRVDRKSRRGMALPGRGILIAPNGHYVRGGRDPFDWHKLLRLLQNNRPRRPLDGIVVAIDANDLVGPNALDESQLAIRAARLSEMLSQAQKVLGFAFRSIRLSPSAMKSAASQNSARTADAHRRSYLRVVEPLSSGSLVFGRLD